MGQVDHVEGSAQFLGHVPCKHGFPASAGAKKQRCIPVSDTDRIELLAGVGHRQDTLFQRKLVFGKIIESVIEGIFDILRYQQLLCLRRQFHPLRPIVDIIDYTFAEPLVGFVSWFCHFLCADDFGNGFCSFLVGYRHCMEQVSNIIVKYVILLPSSAACFQQDGVSFFCALSLVLSWSAAPRPPGQCR